MTLGVFQDEENLSRYDAIFPAKLTAKAGTPPVYTFVEQQQDAAGDYSDDDAAREGDAREINDADVDITDEPLVWMRFRVMVEGDEVYEFSSPPPVDAVPGKAGPCKSQYAKIQTTDILQAVGPSNSVALRYDGAGNWVSTDQLTYPWGAGLVKFWYDGGDIHCSLKTPDTGTGSGLVPGVYKELLGCGDGCFEGGPLTGHAAPSGVAACSAATFTVCINCLGAVPPFPCWDNHVMKPTMFVTFSSSDCAGMNVTIPIVWDGGSTWAGNGGACGGSVIQFSMSCTMGTWQALYEDASTYTNGTPFFIPTYSPFSASGTGTANFATACCPLHGVVNWTVTE